MAFSKESKHFLIGVGIFLLCLLIPAENGLTQVGVQTLALLITTIYYWLFIDMGWSSVLALVGMALIGSIGAPAAVFAGSIGQNTCIFATYIIIINHAMADNGVTERIAFWFLTRKIAKNRPWMFITMFFMSAWVIGLIMDQTALMIVYLTFIDSITKAVGSEKGEGFGKVLTMGSLACICAGYFGTPFAHAVPIVMIGMIKNLTGVDISLLRYVMLGIPFTFLFFICVVLVSRFLVKPDVSKLKGYDAEKARAALPPLSKEAKAVTFSFIFCVVSWLFPDVFKSVFPTASAYVKSMMSAVPTMLAVVSLCIISVNKETKKPVLNLGKSLSKVPWTVITFMGTITAFSTCITSENTGINVFLSNLFAPIAAGIPPFGLVMFGLAGTVILTNFISNVVSQTIFYTLLAPIFLANPNFGISAVALGVMLTFMANTAIMTPPATGPTPYVYSSGYVTTKDGFTYGGPLVLCSYILALLFWPLANMLF